ncbi:MAG: YeeE/YedE family protein [Polyangiaceae bacterium]|nr:YeeE/YedE family protein [Polyangiaceae bacterium]
MAGPRRPPRHAGRRRAVRVGWALSGACPSIALVQLGEGQLGGLVTLVGIFAGNFVYSIVHERHFRWSTSSCVD